MSRKGQMMASRYQNVDQLVAIHRIDAQVMFLANGSKWGFLTNHPRGEWESGDEVIISAIVSKKVMTLYSVKNINKSEVLQVVLLGEPFDKKQRE